jgi:uncharacterized protein YecE (DUF72 family)
VLIGQPSDRLFAAVAGILRSMIRIGTAGWGIPRAMAAKFPGDGPHLARYARGLRCVEIDTSFYRSHAFATYQKWAALTPRGFRFCVKLPRTITHYGKLKNARVPLEQFLAEVAGLGGKLGALLVQLPPSLAFDVRGAGAFFTLLRKLHVGPVICEPRHSTWFEAGASKLLARFQIGRVAADPAIVAQAARPGGWMGAAGRGAGAMVYYRWHGSPRLYWSDYPIEQLRKWREEVDGFPRKADVWCIFDNTAAGAALENALQLSQV